MNIDEDWIMRERLSVQKIYLFHGKYGGENAKRIKTPWCLIRYPHRTSGLALAEA